MRSAAASSRSSLVAYENGASLLKFGGDSLLLWFERSDHVVRGCRACVLMRRVLRDVGTHHAARCPNHAAHDARRAQRDVPFLRGRYVASRAASGRPRLEPPWSRWSTQPTPARSWSARETAAALPRKLPRRRARRGPAPRCATRRRARRAIPLMPRPPIRRRAACPLPAARGSRARVARRRYPGASARSRSPSCGSRAPTR